MPRGWVWVGSPCSVCCYPQPWASFLVPSCPAVPTASVPLGKGSPHAACPPPCCTVAGTLGTLAGGSLLDAIGSSMRNALLLCAVGIGAGACLAVAAFWAAGSFALFALIFAAAQLAMFSSAVGC